VKPTDFSCQAELTTQQIAQSKVAKGLPEKVKASERMVSLQKTQQKN